MGKPASANIRRVGNNPQAASKVARVLTGNQAGWILEVTRVNLRGMLSAKRLELRGCAPCPDSVIGAGDSQTLDSTPKSPKPIVTQGPLASTGVNKPHIHVGSDLCRIEILFFES